MINVFGSRSTLYAHHSDLYNYLIITNDNKRNNVDEQNDRDLDSYICVSNDPVSQEAISVDLLFVQFILVQPVFVQSI